MPTWETYTAQEEANELDKWALSVEATLLQHLTRLAWRPRGCFQVTLSPKDGDLMSCGCYGIDRVRIGEDVAMIEFAQHWTIQYCEACQEAHRVSEFDEWCDDDIDSQYDSDVEERRDCKVFALPESIQGSADDHDTVTYAAYDILARSIVDACEQWSEEGL